MARASSALVVDSDIKGLEALVYGFQGADWRITACPAPESASFLVKASGAELVVVAVREGHEKVLAMLRQLRASPESRALPVLVLGPAALRAALGDVGSIDLLPLPVFVRDVITASRLLVNLGAVPKPGEEARLEGTMAEFGLLSLVRTMVGLKRSGVLHVDRGGRRGEITFAEGEVAGAQLGALQGASALHHMLLWDEDGRIELRLRSVARRANQQRPEQLLDEAERFLRDYSHAMKDVGPASTVYRRDEVRLSKASRDVPAEVTPVVRLFDSQRTLGAVLDESPFRVFDTLRIINRLVYLGILVRRDPKPMGPENRPLQDFWSTARITGVNSALAAPADAPAPARIDSRIGSPSRRKSQRRVSSQTLDLGAPLLDAEPTTPGATTERRDANRRSDGQPVPGRDRPVAPPASWEPHHPAVVRNEDEMSKPPLTPPPQAALLPAEIPKGIGATKLAGTLSVASAHRAASRSKPPGGISVEFDPSLQAEMAALESTPPPVTARASGPATPEKTASDAAADSHAAGVIAGPASHRGPAKAQGGMSVDPALLAELEVLEKTEQALPAFRSAAVGSTEATPTSADKTSVPPKGKVTGEQPKRRPTGGFSAIEADFFAREAELYKQDDSSFADLDEPAGKSKGPRKPHKR
jgi:hypothetical protein